MHLEFGMGDDKKLVSSEESSLAATSASDENGEGSSNPIRGDKKPRRSKTYHGVVDSARSN